MSFTQNRKGWNYSSAITVRIIIYIQDKIYGYTVLAIYFEKIKVIHAKCHEYVISYVCMHTSKCLSVNLALYIALF